MVRGDRRVLGDRRSIARRSAGARAAGIPARLSRRRPARSHPPGSPTLGLKLPHGTAVKKVEANSPAAAAGLKRGDIVVEINGKSVADTGQFLKVIASKTPGTVVTVRLLRDGRLRAGPVKLGVKLAEALAASMPHPEKAPEPVLAAARGASGGRSRSPRCASRRTSPRREIYRGCCACGALRLPGPAAAWRGTQGVRGGHRLAGVSIQRTRPLRRSRTVAEAGAGDARAPVGQGASGYADQRQ